VTVSARATGIGNPLGATSGCGLAGTPAGRAAMRISQPPFTFPAVAVEGGTVAFLESESGQNGCDQNGDDDVVDGILRVFRLGFGETAITPARAIDAAPLIDGLPVAVSGGRVYVRTSEPSMATPVVELASRSFSTGNAPTTNQSETFDISGDGRYVVYASMATDILPPGDFGNLDIFVYDRVNQTTERASEAFGGGNSNGSSYWAVMARHGRYVAFDSTASNLTATPDPLGFHDIFVRDLVTDTTELVSVAAGGGVAGGNVGGPGGSQPAISDDGRYVAFVTAAKDVLPPEGQADEDDDIIVRDRCVSDGVPVVPCTPSSTLVSPDSGGTSPAPSYIAMSGDGQWVGWVRVAFPFTFSIRTHNVFTGETRVIDLAFDGGPPAGTSNFIGGLSYDGRYVLFMGSASNLLAPGKDTNGDNDAFVRDTVLGVTERVSVATDGTQADGSIYTPVAHGLSSDGRFAAFVNTPVGSLIPGYPPTVEALFIRDRASGTTQLVNTAADGTFANAFGGLGSYGLSADGRTIAFMSQASNLTTATTDTNTFNDSYVRGPDPADPLGVDALLFPNGSLTDSVLEVVDGATGAVTTHCAAGEVSVAGGNAVYLRPESAAGTPACPGGSLNGDGDTTDEVVQLVVGAGATQNLGRAATTVRTSGPVVAALVSEAGQGATNLNGDADTADTVLHVYPLAAAMWTNTTRAADALAVSGTRVAFITPEASQGAGSLNGDADTADRVADLYDVTTATVRGVGVAAEDMVLGDATGTVCGTRQLLAIRTPEAAQGAADANGDGDALDDVLTVYDAETDTLIDVGQAITPCRLEACDPRTPYRVNGGEVRFLTFEMDQDEDLDGNGSIGGLVLQSFDVCTGVTTARSAPSTRARRATRPSPSTKARSSRRPRDAAPSSPRSRAPSRRTAPPGRSAIS
jgi:Tol biopolymer transport system component